MKNRPGFTLAELLVVMVVTSLIGASIAQLMTVQSQFMHRQEGRFNARAIARGPTGLILSDLRAVETDGGIVAASPSSITLRVPVAQGISCGTSGTTLVVMVQPLDAVAYAEAFSAGGGYSGWAWTNASNVVNYNDTNAIPNFADYNSTCTAAGLVVPTAPLAFLTARLSSSDAVPAGGAVFFYQKINYAFGNSTSLTGRTALFRTVVDRSATEEISAPYDPASQFAFYVVGSATPQATAPADLTTIRGIELQLTGINERTTNVTDAERAPLRTAVFFKN
jgi:prepilin-type N-terminal cleavage/methylation domain-containing protein